MSEEKISDNTIQVVTFTITEKSSKKGNYAIPIEQVKEIKTIGPITKIPRSRSYVKGVMNLRGKIIPVIDVNNKIGFSDLSDSNHTKQRILVVDINNVFTGLLVNEVNEVLRLNKKDIETVPLEAFEDSRYISGIAKVNDKLLVILDIPKFLSENENIKAPSESIESSSKEYNLENKSEEILPEIEEIINQEIHNK